MFHSFSFPTYYLLQLCERRKNLANGIFFSYIAGLHMSREIMLKWCKTKPTIDSEYVRALSNLAMIIYIYLICYAKSPLS